MIFHKEAEKAMGERSDELSTMGVENVENSVHNRIFKACLSTENVDNPSVIHRPEGAGGYLCAICYCSIRHGFAIIPSVRFSVRG